MDAGLRRWLSVLAILLLLVALSLQLPIPAAATSFGKMYWTDLGPPKISRANLDGSAVEDVATDPSGSLALDVAGGKLYWTLAGDDGKVRRANLDGSGVEDLVTGLYRPNGIALDLAAGKMYYVTDNGHTIQRADLSGANAATVLASLSEARHLALDTVNGKLYWSDAAQDAVSRANLNGTGTEVLVSSQTGPYGIALDVPNNSMYWTDTSEGTIQRAALDGSGVVALVSGRPIGPGIALDVVAGKMYWVTLEGTGLSKIQRANLDGSGVEDLVTGLSVPHGLSLDLTTFSYSFSGFFHPVDNLPTLNQVNAGRAIPVKFSLSGDQGLDIFMSGYPASQRIDCDSSLPTDMVEETVTAGSSSLSYDAATDTYTYVWKTSKSWAGTCRQLNVKLADGSDHFANFKLK
ncbi:MAG TPA: PxKF domain-containing protein [Roseiflexaceae bacterium]|nr:PxKF domain-containing protein [Roseiflexaceae bacterium]